MNKKYIRNNVIVLFLGFILVSKIFAEQVNTVVVLHPINQISPVIVDKLDYKSIFMKFHKKDLRYLKMKQPEGQGVGLINADGKIQYAVFKPIVSYINLQGEERFIVRIEKFDQENGEIINGHPSYPQVELYLFKRLQGGQYQLLSQTRPEIDISGSWGESHLKDEDFRSIHQVGKNQLGLTYSGGYTSSGEMSEYTNLIVLNESGWIEQYPFGRSADNTGAYETDDPDYGGYSAEYHTLKDTSAQDLYPIQVNYTRFGNKSWYESFPKDGTTEILKFDLKRNCYIHQGGRCDN